MSPEAESGSDPQSLGHSSPRANEDSVPEFIIRQIERYQRDPESAHYWDARPYGGYENTPSLLLKSRGRRTGQMRTRPLIYARDEDRYVVVGSRGGGSQDPSWILNIQADRNVEIQVVHQHFLAVAIIVTGAERRRLWDLSVALFPPYVDYQKCSEHEIPVVVLTPCAAKFPLPDSDTSS